MTPNTVFVSHIESDRFAIQIGEHRLEVDQPLDSGGNDKAPTPTELFVASLAACVAYYGRHFLKRHRLPEKLQVSASWTLAQGPARVSDIEIHVTVEGMPEQMLGRFARVIEHCTVQNTLNHRPRVAMNVHRSEISLDDAV